MRKSNRVRGKNIVITGASSGIGADVALEVASQGGIPILLARRVDKLEELVRQIEKEYTIKAYAIELDVSNKQAIVNVFESIYEKIGEIDVLINNAGFALFKDASEATYEEVKAMFEVNVLGLIACTTAVLPTMKAKNTGQIINVASIIGKIPTPKASAYAATKHAVLGFTNALRMEISDTNIQITSVNPGPVKTEFFNIADVSGNYTKNVDKMMLDSKTVAKKIVTTIGTKKRELNLPVWMGFGGKCYALMPVLMENILGERLFKK
jgi:short-subunit dehydrogenase